ncbi:MAG: hypothetical protein A2040_09215 [Rhodocyclales bacterium GWA2_65_19]|nr:MAG: hypothetical protein A2040_09215 [Rhodocyclales bacterium GWA2_65_19]
MGSGGAYVVTWYGRDSAGDDSIFVQKFNADGTTTGNVPVQLEAIGVTNGGDYRPQVTAVGSGGAYVVTWYGIDSGGDYSIFVQKFNADGTVATVTVTAINADSTAIVRSSEPGTAYLVNSSVSVSSLADITAAADNLWNSATVVTADTDTAIALSGLIKGNYKVYTADAAGNLSTASAVGMTIDTVATINAVATDDIINAAEQTAAITGTCEAGATVALTIGSNTRAATVSGTSWSYTLTAEDITAMGQGAETLSATQTDAAGNVSAAATRGISVDTAVPSVSSVALTNATGAQNGYLNAGDTVTATVTFNEAVSAGGPTPTGRYLRIYHSSSENALVLTELKVMSAGQNVAAGKSSSYGADTGVIDTTAGSTTALTDGVAGGNWNNQNGDASNLAWVLGAGKPYIELDLGASHAIDSLVLWGLAGHDTGQSGNLRVFISNTPPTGATYADLSANTSVAQYDVGSVNGGDSGPGTTVAAAPQQQLALDIGGTTVQADYQGGSGTNALSFTYTVQAGQTDADGIAVAANALALNGGTLKDAAGNAATITHNAVATNASYKVDTTAPAVALTAATDDVGTVTGSVASGGTTNDTALVLSGTTEAGATVNVYNGATLLGAATVSGTTWSYSATVANGTTYQFNAKATDAAGNTSAATANHTIIGDTTVAAPVITDNVSGLATGTVTYTFNFSEGVTGFDASDVTLTNGTKGAFTVVSASQYTLAVSVPDDGDVGSQPTGLVGTDLGLSVGTGYTDLAAGNAPASGATAAAQVYVDPVIDLGAYGMLIAPVHVDGKFYYYWDRSGDGTNANTGSLNGGVDYMTHDALDTIFNSGSDTTNSARSAVLDGLSVMLPTHGEASVVTGYRPGTAIDNIPLGETNPTYDDLLAIWDAHNGTGTTGLPSGWQHEYYWSATPSASGHASVHLYLGYVYDYPVTHGAAYSVALQVL